MPNEIRVNGLAPIRFDLLHHVTVAIVNELGGLSIYSHRDELILPWGIHFRAQTDTVQAYYLFLKNKIISIICSVAQYEIMGRINAAMRYLPFCGSTNRVSIDTSILECLPT